MAQEMVAVTPMTRRAGVIKRSSVSSLLSSNTKISSEGRHRECPDLVCCILLFYGAFFGPVLVFHGCGVAAVTTQLVFFSSL